MLHLPPAVFALALTLLVAPASAGDAFEVTTPGSPGTDGLVPVLAGSGPASPGSDHGALRLSDARPSSAAVFVSGLAELAAPFKGGVFGPTPTRLFFGQATNAEGEIVLPLIVAPDTPVGLELWTQFWVADPAGFGDYASSNTLRVQVQPDTGDGPLFARPLFDAPHQVHRLAVGDLDGDGLADLAVPDGSSFGGGFVTLLRGDGAGAFARAESHLVGRHSSAVALVDLDVDGHDDLVVGFDDPDTPLAIHWNDGHGGFDASLEFPALIRVRALGVGDVDGDGLNDVLALREVDDVQALLAVPGGPPVVAPSTNVGGVCTDLALGDFDGDGALDAALANETAERVSVLLGDGAGGFGAPQHVALTGRPVSIACADLDGDGALDLAVVMPITDDAAVLLGDGTGGFVAGAPFLVGKQPVDVEAADVDGDGAPDLVVADRDRDQLVLLPGDGAGGFAPELRFEVGDRPVVVEIVDLDLDGALDLVSANELSRDVSPLLGDGAGGFGVPQPQQVPMLHAIGDPALGDLDGDGLLDAVFGTGIDVGMVVCLGLPGGALGPPTTVEAGFDPDAFVLGDFDGDGALDLLASNPENPADNPVPSLTLRLGLGDGGFGASSQLDVSDTLRTLIAADLDGDGDLDAVATSDEGQSTGYVQVILGDGRGGFTLAPPISAPGASGVRAADLDGDAVLDLVVGTRHFQMLTLRGVGDGSFHAANTQAIPNHSTALVVMDANGDDVPDVVTAGPHGTPPQGGASLLLGVGDGTLLPARPVPDLLLAGQLVSTDFNDDGLPDLAARFQADDVRVLLGLGAGEFAVPRAFKVPGGNGGLAAGDLDLDGVPDLVVAMLQSTDPLDPGAPKALVLLNQLRE